VRAVLVDLETSILFGVLLSWLLYLRHASKPRLLSWVPTMDSSFSLYRLRDRARDVLVRAEYLEQLELPEDYTYKGEAIREILPTLDKSIYASYSKRIFSKCSVFSMAANSKGESEV
jgi:hypothetical protein